MFFSKVNFYHMSTWSENFNIIQKFLKNIFALKIYELAHDNASGVKLLKWNTVVIG